jgi:hypothetical protein
MAANKQGLRLKKVGDLSAVSEEPNHFLSSTQDHIMNNLSQEQSSDIIIAPLRVEMDINHIPTNENVINTDEPEDTHLNCKEEMNSRPTPKSDCG